MFTGLVLGTAKVGTLVKKKTTATLALTPNFKLGKVSLGESIALNGCCLTVSKKKKEVLFFDISTETLKRTNLGAKKKGDLVNLERSLRLSDRLGGHLVLGHVDNVGKVFTIKKNKKFWEIKFIHPSKGERYLVSKGCITVDGVSLTVNLKQKSQTGSCFVAYVIPHTLKCTSLHALKEGDKVNLEYDIIAKYVEKKYGFKKSH